jgi:hypothetical protein
MRKLTSEMDSGEWRNPARVLRYMQAMRRFVEASTATFAGR